MIAALAVASCAAEEQAAPAPRDIAIADIAQWEAELAAAESTRWLRQARRHEVKLLILSSRVHR